MKKVILLVLVLTLCIASEVAKADFIWMQKGDMPTPRWTHTSAVVNGKIYVIGGGESEPGDKVLSAVEEYDPVTDTWTRKADMPIPRGWISPSSAVVDGKIYVIGGDDGVSMGSPAVQEYDPATDTWTRRTDMPTSRWCLATCAVDGKIYAIGGAAKSISGLNVVEQYDPITDTWTKKADMPTGLWGLCACEVNGKIYTLGGRPVDLAIPTVQEYDPATDTWTQKSDIPVGTSQMASVVLGDRIVVIGGWRISTTLPYTTMQMYNPATDTWTKEDDVPFLRATVTGEVVKNRIYVIGGTDRPHPCPAFPTVYEFGPLLDFNDDCIVDAADVCILIDNWHMNSTLCDIAPLPLSDGYVDVQDLVVMAEHLFEEVLPLELIAYWRLDETEGGIAENTVGDNDGVLLGEPLWQPTGGMKDGALQLDGIDDYVSADLVLNPADGPFSAFAWVSSSVPGGVVISQVDGIGGSGETWLGIEPVSGKLMTSLVAPPLGRFKQEPMVSESVITNNQWHYVGYVWDGSYRILYVDGIEVAKDTTPQNPLKPATGGLYIGAGKNLEAGTFFSGLIDDIRIYNKALSAEQIAALAQ
jgi:N-acetylneuraminic acid mutarotase